MLVGGCYFGREALADLVHERRVGTEFLMGASAVAPALQGAPGEGAMLAFLYSISEAAEGYTEEKARAAVRALMKPSPRPPSGCGRGARRRSPSRSWRSATSSS